MREITARSGTISDIPLSRKPFYMEHSQAGIVTNACFAGEYNLTALCRCGFVTSVPGGSCQG